MAAERITIHGHDWDHDDIADSVVEARALDWSAARCEFSATEHRHCLVCWWELHSSSDATRANGYVAGQNWLCCECYGRFVADDELGLGHAI